MRKSTQQKPRRLTAMQIHAVAFVDRGANQKARWILAKREVDMPETSAPVVEPAATEAAPAPVEAAAVEAEKAAEMCAECGKPMGACKCGAKKADEEPTAEAEKAAETPATAPEAAPVEAAPAVEAEKAAEPVVEPAAVEPAAPVVEPVPDADVEKVGRKMSKARLERLKSAFSALGELMKELEGDASEGAEKAADAEPNPVIAAIEALTAKVDAQTTEIAALTKRLETPVAKAAPSVRPAPQSMQSEGDVPTPPDVWPYDLTTMLPRNGRG